MPSVATTSAMGVSLSYKPPWLAAILAPPKKSPIDATSLASVCQPYQRCSSLAEASCAWGVGGGGASSTCACALEASSQKPSPTQPRTNCLMHCERAKRISAIYSDAKGRALKH